METRSISFQPSLGVSILIEEDQTVVASMPTGTGHYGIAYDSGKGEVFVANVASNMVSIISDSASSTSASSTAPEFPTTALGFVAVGPTAFVALSSRRFKIRPS